jgi:hypothetical protein
LATVKDRLISGQIGRLGGNVIYNSQGQKVVRSYKKTNSSNSDIQIFYRNCFSYAKDLWNNFTETQLKEWRQIYYSSGSKIGAFQFWIKCYLTGTVPMPFNPYSIVFEKEISVSEILAFAGSPVVLIGAPVASKYLFARLIQIACDNPNFSITAFSLLYGNGRVFSGQNFSLPVFRLGAYNALGFDCGSSPAGVCGQPICWTFGSFPVLDLGSSTSIFVHIEYSILNWFGPLS